MDAWRWPLVKIRPRVRGAFLLRAARACGCSAAMAVSSAAAYVPAPLASCMNPSRISVRDAAVVPKMSVRSAATAAHAALRCMLRMLDWAICWGARRTSSPSKAAGGGGAEVDAGACASSSSDPPNGGGGGGGGCASTGAIVRTHAIAASTTASCWQDAEGCSFRYASYFNLMRSSKLGTLPCQPGTLPCTLSKKEPTVLPAWMPAAAAIYWLTHCLGSTLLALHSAADC